MTLGDYVKKNKINVLALAKKLKMHHQSLYDYINFKSQPPLDKAVKIVAYSRKYGKGRVRYEDLVQPKKKQGTIKPPVSPNNIYSKEDLLGRTGL